MKVFKRNAVILTVLLFVCVAVYLNWSYGKKGEKAAETGQSAQQEAASHGETGEEGVPAQAEGDAGLYYAAAAAPTQEEGAGVTSVSAYFDTVRLSREQARSSARETFLTVSQADGAAQDTVDDALASITQMADWAVRESELEGEILAKGFADCVVFFTEEGVTVTVPAPETGLTQAAVARITDIVLERTDYTAAQLRIVEVK